METTTTGPRTRALLLCGALAGPIYVLTALVQGLTRAGFDLLRHDVSLLANGDLGWIQIANFLVTGALVIACAVGVRRVAGPGRRTAWGAALVGLYGAGLICAGVFVADPVAGFPPGTPGGTISWHGLLHLLSAAVAFFALAAACFVLARTDGPGWARYSRVTGVLFLAGFLGGVAGGALPAGVLALWVAVLLGWAWIVVLAVRLRRREEVTA